MAYIECNSGGGNYPVVKLAGHTVRLTETLNTSNYRHSVNFYLDGVQIGTSSIEYYAERTVTAKIEGTYATEGAYNLVYEKLLNATGTSATAMKYRILLNNFVIYESAFIGLSTSLDSGDVIIK